jgi:hypothetical protein
MPDVTELTLFPDPYIPVAVMDSPMEARLWFAAEQVRPGLPAADWLTPQYPVFANGRQYYLDFAVSVVLPWGLKIGIEVDGLEAHSSPLDIARDHKRQRDLESAGWVIIRFGGSEIYHDAVHCIEEIIECLIREIRRGFPPQAA